MDLKKFLSPLDISYLRRTIGQPQDNWFQNIYLYITWKCQLACRCCYLGEERLKRATTMPLDQIFTSLRIWRELGGKKLCFIGGEPTLHPQFEEAAQYAHNLGYEKVTIDTNGLRSALDKLNNFNCSNFTCIQISLDGASPETHDKIRGEGTFKIVMNTIKELCKKGFDVRIICTVNKVNMEECLNILPLADEFGVTLVKYHIFSGIGKGKKETKWVLNPYEWIEFIRTLSEQKGKYRAKIQYQPAYTLKRKEYRYLAEGYEGCIGRKLERASIFPDGRVYVCSYLFDTDLNFATEVNREIRINRKFSELDLFIERDDECNNCEFSKTCSGGCPAEKIVTGSLPCKSYPDVFPICRLWKSTV